MGVSSRWIAAVVAALLCFGGCWTGLAIEKTLDTGSQVGVSSVPLVVVLAVMGAWAERAREKKQSAAGLRDRVGASAEGSSQAQVTGQVSGGFVFGPGTSMTSPVFNVGVQEDLGKEPLRDELAGSGLVKGDSQQRFAGWPLAEVTDPFALEVHWPVSMDDSPSGLPVLPTYVQREHDKVLSAVVRKADTGSSEIAVLVGGSSTGKTRACWEALNLLRGQPSSWRLWHPIDPSRPDAALRDLLSIGPRSVVWLNEAQFYLDTSDPLGERVAARIREILRDPSKRPVLVLATLWPQFWSILTTRPPAEQEDTHAQARELLSGRDITVPGAFTVTEVQSLTDATDPRLVMAANARDGQVVQFLAGAPELLARYRNAPPIATALISAAIDGRRLGMGVALSLSFLEAAAGGYVTEDEWDRLDEDWLSQALTYTAADSKGTRGPLTPIHSRSSRDGSYSQGSAWRLADYLDQHGRKSRHSVIPPKTFWTAAARFASPGELSALARAAEVRGLFQAAAQLRKRAARHGDSGAAAALITSLHTAHLAVAEAAIWAAEYARLDDPRAVAWLLWAMANADADDQVEALLARNPAAHANLDDCYAVSRLVLALWNAGADEQVGILASRAAGHANVTDPYGVARLLRALRSAGTVEQAAILAGRAAAEVNLDDSRAVARLLGEIRVSGATEVAAALLARNPAALARPDDPRAIAWLLRELGEAGAGDQVKILAAHANLDDPRAVARLLKELREADALDWAKDLFARDPAASVELDDPIAVASLLRELRRAGAASQVKILLARIPDAQTNLDDPNGVASLLRELRRSSAPVKVWATHAVEIAVLDEAGAVARLLWTLCRVGADDQATALLARDPAASVRMDDARGVGSLLHELREAGAGDQASALLARDPAASMRVDDARGVGSLLHELREAGADDQASALLARDPAASVKIGRAHV